ncbi:MAG TPA: hypothetical protein VGH03_16635 [Caulobacteraceae bacterium]
MNSIPDFRLYFLNQRDHIVEARNLECVDDEAAVEAVESHRDGRAMELWRRDRRIRIFPQNG